MFNIEKPCIGSAHIEVVKFVDQFGLSIQTEDGEWCKQLAEPVSVMVYKPLMEPMIAKCSPYTQKFMDNYTTQVTTTSNSGFSYTYGNRLRNYRGIDQLQGVINVLNMHPTSRRAIMHTWMVDQDLGNTMVPCLQTIQFCINKDKVNCVAMFRSNDMLMAWGPNAYALARILDMVCKGVNRAAGYLEIISVNAHVYTHRDGDVLNKFLGV